MRKVLLVSFLAAVVLSLGCAITDYPVITDTAGPNYRQVMQSFYDWAYIIPSGQVATIWSNGSDELYSEVVQDWKGDQWIDTYNNFDPSGMVNFLQQIYCDPTFQSKQWCTKAWNPDLPNVYPHGDQGSGYNNVDNVFDYFLDLTAPGCRSLSLLVSYTSRLGECGSGVWADKQGLAYEFSVLNKVNYRGKDFYHVPIDSSVASFEITGQDGARATAPIFGRFNAYLDDSNHMLFPMSPNARYQLNWFNQWTKAHGTYMDVAMTYGSLQSNFKLNLQGAERVLDRF